MDLITTQDFLEYGQINIRAPGEEYDRLWSDINEDNFSMMNKYANKSRQSIEEVPKKAEDKKGKNTLVKGEIWTKKSKEQVGLKSENQVNWRIQIEVFSHFSYHIQTISSLSIGAHFSRRESKYH